MVEPIKSSVDARKTKELVTKVQKLEETVMALAQAVNQALIELNQSVSHLQAVMDATTEEVGQDKVQLRLDAKADLQKLEIAQNAQNRLKEMEAAGKLVATETIGPRSVVVGRELDAEGNVLAPAYVQFQMGDSLPPYLKSLLGGSVLTKAATPDATTIEVTAIYDVVTPTPPAMAIAEPEQNAGG